jgi:hypothetical protein
LGAGSLILILLVDLPVVFLAFFGGVGITGVSCFPTRVDAPALAPAVGSLADSSLRDQTETGITGIGISPSKSGMGEIKVLRACIQTHKE